MASNPDLHIRPTLRRAWELPFTTRSDFCRDNAEMVMRAIEEGYLTLRRGAGAWTNLIHITPAGLAHLDPLGYAPTAADEIPKEENEQL